MTAAVIRHTDACRVCGNTELVRVLDLGEQTLTGVFPRSREEQITRGPLALVKCHGADSCGLLQLEHTYDAAEMYGAGYGYRSGLNASMSAHLNARAQQILSQEGLRAGDMVVDIGSNDGTSLNAFPGDAGLHLLGIDPSGGKFRQYYRPDVSLLPDFFSAALLSEHAGGRSARVISSYSMFYDLEQPLEFAREVASSLVDGGLWVFEQSYMPTMLSQNAYDTVCHEHLEYYGLKQIVWIAERAGFSIERVEFNDINGGSFCVFARKTGRAPQHSGVVDTIIGIEESRALHTLAPYRAFSDRVDLCRHELRSFLERSAEAGRKICGLGASTKGNVVLQHAGIGPELLPVIGEVNADKFGCFTPGSLIPIVPEEAVLGMAPDALLLLPWHFEAFFRNSGKFAGTSLVAPLPWLRML